MIIYFADRRMSILGMASTELPEGFTIKDDLKTEETDTGVATFECTIPWDDDTRADVEACTAAGNYLLRSDNGDNEFYTIIEAVNDTKNQAIDIYAEDAGMDLLNETVGAYEATEAHPAAWYVEKYAEDTGFEIGINEISDLSRTLKWEGEATAAERIASIATEFDNAEISYSFDIEGLTITHKYINIHKKRGKDAGYQLFLNRDIDKIITTTSVADLATALYVTGGTPEGEEEAEPISLKGYQYDDGDIYVMEGTPILCKRSALTEWSRYVWAKEPNQIEGYTGNIIKQWSYDTTSQSELCNRAITQLNKVSEPAVNYEIDITTLPENVGIGDYVDIVDEKGELYLNSRILKLTTSRCNQKQTATLGEFLIKESGIAETVRELAEQFSQLAKSRQFYTWIAYADDEYGDGISLDPTDKAYMGTATNRTSAEVDISDPSIFKWALIQGEGVGIENIITWYGKSDTPTVVPTEWQDTPYELLHNEYQWSYVEYDYTNGVVVYTEPHIIAYYDYLSVEELEARVAKIEEAYVSYEEVETLVANDVEAAVLNAGFLTADSAIIESLTAFSESAYVLLGGEGSFGELQSIHLSTNNAVIDYGVIVNAVAGTLLADLITAEYIDTNMIKIGSEDGTFLIDGSTLLIKDADGNYRIQIGLDENGDYNLALWDSEGNCMWNATGATEYGINDGVIRNDMVADDAAIEGSKLDIESVAQCLTEDGTLIVDAGQVTINDTTLSAWYTTVTEELEGLAGLTTEGLMKTEPWFCLWDSDTTAPPEDEELTQAVCGVAICGLTICGKTDGILWVSYDLPVINGLYKWVKWKGYYADGHEEWGIPYCLTDGYLRQETSVLQTQLAVVQGQISAKVWMTDITEAITTTVSDLWSELDIWLGGIEAEVGQVSTEVSTVEGNLADVTKTVEDMNEQVASLIITTGGISTQVSDIESKLESIEGLNKFTCYFCLWCSDTEYPPNNEDLTPAVCGIGLCGTMLCGVTGDYWTTDEPVAGDGQYEWIKYLCEYDNGDIEWIGPYCLTDGYSREQLENLNSEVEGAYSTIDQMADSITMQVTEMSSYVNTALSGIEELNDSLDAYYEVMQSTFEQLADSFNLTISGAIESMQETADGMQNQLDEYATYFQFTRDGLSIGELNSPFAMLLGATQLSFTEAGEIMAYFSNSMLYVYDVQILNTLRIGNFRWQPGTDGNLNLVRVGEVAE